ncbi:FecR family protein [Mucilaginibacter sp. L196]|uniref:FecR family protein n=1 Tax=Mucilaginibacter sp. L196 TaxID=1641870 RepID=UPI00131AF7F8|nr:FecR family protein [Mucilaginibacter sp. L196]
MNRIDTRLIYLFNLYFEKTATQDEVDELFKLLQTSDDEQLTFFIRQAWDDLQVTKPLFDPSQSEDILNRILHTRTAKNKVFNTLPIKKMFVWRKFATAAAVLFFIGIGFYLQNKVNKPQIITAKLLHDVMPGGNKATLTLANGSSIILDTAHNGVLAKQGNSIINKTKNGQLVYSADPNEQAATPVTNTISTPRGGQYQVVLPDGSKVWLNAASSIKYPTFFNGKKRLVEITGEAYFEVAKNASMPFIVKSNRAEVEVLGTHFNIMAYDDETLMKTTLLEGSVKITSGKTSDILKPGEQALLNEKGQLQVTDDVDVNEETAWKNGLFQFKDADVESIMRQLGRWYNVTISYEGKICARQYTGKISRNVKASELLNMLKYTGLNSRIEGKNIIITN